MDKVNLHIPALLQEFLDATQEITFTGAPAEYEHQGYEHISRVL